jgi:hypothetical protein
MLPETGKKFPVPADVASCGGVHNPPWVWRVGIEGRHLRPHDILGLLEAGGPCRSSFWLDP